MNTLTSILDAKASSVAERVSELGRDAADTIENARKETAGGLHDAASSIRRGGRESSKAIENLAERTANTLDEASSYVRKHDFKRTVGESRQLVRRYPAQSLALAAGAGFCFGLAVRRLTHSCDKSPS